LEPSNRRTGSRSSCPGLSPASTSWRQKKTWMAGTSPAMTVDRREDEQSFRGLRGSHVAREIDDLELGGDALGGAILEADHGIDGDAAGAALGVVHDGGLLLIDHAAA